MFTQAIRHTVDTLTQAGVRAATDPAELNPPGVWVTPAGFSQDRQDATTTVVDLVLYLVVTPTRAGQDLTRLDELLDQVRAAGYPSRDGEAVTVTMPNHNQTGLPGYRVPVQLEATGE